LIEQQQTFLTLSRIIEVAAMFLGNRSEPDSRVTE
jgi:hypothetical protein